MNDPGDPDAVLSLAGSADKAAIGERLKVARRRAGFSQERVSQSLGRGFSVASLYRWETGVDLPTFDKMVRVAAFYGTSLDWLAGGTECREVFRVGKLVVDRDALELVDALVAEGGSIGDLSSDSIHHAGLNCAWPVPRRPMMLDGELATAVESRLQDLYDRLCRR